MKKRTDAKNVGFVYFIRNSSWVYKIGITKNLSQRLRQYNLWNHIDLTHILIAKLYEYGKCEREVIAYFKTLPETYKNEWSKLTDAQAYKVIQIALKYKWGFFFNSLEVSKSMWEAENIAYWELYHAININKLVNMCNRFFKLLDFS